MSRIDMNMLPAARVEDLVITESGNEILVYDTQTHVIHHLNPTAATVWGMLDGQQTLASLERAASAALGVGLTREVIESALVSLDGLDLLDGYVAFEAKPANQSRRRFLKRAAAASVAVPVIASITAPAAHAAASNQPFEPSCPIECTSDYQPCWTGGPSGKGNGVCGTCKPKKNKVNEWTCNNSPD